MRLLLIALLFVAGVGYGGYRTYHYFDAKKQAGIEAKARGVALVAAEKARALEEQEKKEQAKKRLEAGPEVQKAVEGGPVSGKPAVVQAAVGSYRFLRRLVPEAPAFLKNEKNAGMIVESDAASNSWVWMGEPVLCSQILDLAKSYDLRQVEMDLDFVLVLVNVERLKSRGFSFMFEEKAGWLDALSLQGDSGSLRLTAGSVAMGLEYGDATTGVSMLAQPVIRCVDGQPWKFSTDSQVPVPKSSITDGTIQQSVEFRSIGFGLEGMVRVIGETVLLTVEQRNGSIAPNASQSLDVPTFNVQETNTTCELGFQEWSVIAGIQVDKEELRKGLFRNSLKASSDYLVIFVRPRLSLDTPPQAVPVGQGRGHPLESGPGVLPSKDWLNDEIGLVEEKVRKMEEAEKMAKSRRVGAGK